MAAIMGILAETWGVLLDASVYILLGLTIAGIIHAFLKTEMIQKYLARGRISSVFYAALLGIPLPLCSCGVIPAAAQLRKSGANKGATTAFLISTPETGVDSIALTYGLIDPVFAVARPLAAAVTATTAGLIENAIDREDAFNPNLPSEIHKEGEKACCAAHAHNNPSILLKLRSGLSHGFGKLIDDIAPTFALGILIAGLIAYLIPITFIETYLSGGFSSMLIMLAVGLPIYVCASASTPIAAAFIAKGMSPGTALVFLLAGPATNAASATVMSKFIGKRAVAVYLATIALLSILFGLALDALYATLALNPQAIVGHGSNVIPYEIRLAGAMILLLLLTKGIWKTTLSPLLKRKDHNSCCSNQ